MILVGDCRERLRGLPERSVQTCVTSPPYFGLRDYGTGEWEGGDAGCDHKGAARQSSSSTLAGNGHGPGRLSPALQAQTVPVRECGKCGARRVDRQIGLEPTPDEFVAALVAVFREVRRVLRDDGTVWLNLGDSYARTTMNDRSVKRGPGAFVSETTRAVPVGLKDKDLIGIPWMVAFALRADGWYLRSDIIWSKLNPMPESVTDRPTKAHEYLFLLSKGPRYFYDADAVREDGKDWTSGGPGVGIENTADRYGAGNGGNGGLADLAGRYKSGEQSAGRNKRSVWTVATQPYAGAHFATFPPKLIGPCILAGSPPKCCGVCGAPWRRVVEREVDGDRKECPSDPAGFAARGNRSEASRASSGLHSQYLIVTSQTTGWESTCTHDDDTGSSVILDPFAGSGTVGVVCGWHGREHVGIELNPDYAAMAEARIALEGRPGGKPAHHEAAAVVAEQLGLL